MWKTHDCDFIVAPEDHRRLAPAKILGCPKELFAARLSDGPTGNRRLLWSLPVGVVGIRQESHFHDHLLYVVEGRGVIAICGLDSPYARNDAHMVYAQELHGLRSIEEPTLILQIQPSIEYQRLQASL